MSLIFQLREREREKGMWGGWLAGPDRDAAALFGAVTSRSSRGVARRRVRDQSDCGLGAAVVLWIIHHRHSPPLHPWAPPRRFPAPLVLPPSAAWPRNKTSKFSQNIKWNLELESKTNIIETREEEINPLGGGGVTWWSSTSLLLSVTNSEWLILIGMMQSQPQGIPSAIFTINSSSSSIIHTHNKH